MRIRVYIKHPTCLVVEETISGSIQFNGTLSVTPCTRRPKHPHNQASDRDLRFLSQAFHSAGLENQDVRTLSPSMNSDR